jgi:hypothetical protein
MQRLLKMCALLIVITTASSCGSKPVKPNNIWDCRLIIEEMIGFCINNTTLEEKEISISEMDKYVAFSNEDWARILIYIKQLESVTPKKYKKYIINFDKINKKHIHFRQK